MQSTAKKPTKKKPARTNFGYTEEALANALIDIREKNKGIRETCRHYGIPRSTIQDRLSGKVTEKPRKVGPDPIFGFEGETKIVNWIIDLAKCGLPVNKEDLLNTVADLAKELKKDKCFPGGKPGIKWYQNFLKRHPEISVREPESINKAREAVKESGIRKWFTDLEVFLAERGLSDILKDPNRILNGDETGISLCPKTGRVLAPKGFKNVYTVKKGNEKETITVLIVMTASGEICPPLVVFPYIKPPRGVVASMPDDWVLGKTESGWMRSDVFYEYIANDFNNWLLEKKVQKPVLLFVDGHKSHMSMPLSEFCEANDIILYALPPNTTHILQPADVSVFRPLKQNWKKTVISWQSKPENINKVVTKTNFCKVFKETLNAEMVDTIKNGFRRCGLYPFNVENVDFTKCVKDTQIRHSTAKTAGPKSLTEKHFHIAQAVFSLMRDNIAKLGIDPQIIMLELERTKSTYLKERRSKSRTPKNSKTPRHSHDCTSTKAKTPTAASSIQHPHDSSLTSGNPLSPPPLLVPLTEESSIQIPEIGSMVTLSDISLIPFEAIDISDIISQNENAQIESTGGNIISSATKQVEPTVQSAIFSVRAERHCEEPKSASTPLRDVSVILNNPDKSPEENQVSNIAVTAEIHENPNESTGGNIISSATKQVEPTVQSAIFSVRAERHCEEPKSASTPPRDVSVILNNPDKSPEENQVSNIAVTAEIHENPNESTGGNIISSANEQVEPTVQSVIVSVRAERHCEETKRASTPLRDISGIVNTPDKSPEENRVSTITVTAEIHENPKISKTGTNNLRQSENNTANKQNKITSQRSFIITDADNIEVLEECDAVIDPFQKHLKFPTIPPVTIKRGQVQIPSAISAKAWRDHHERKDKIKQEKENLKKKRKLKRNDRKKEPPAKKKKVTDKEKTAKTKKNAEPKKHKQKCGDYQEDLISDTEDDAEKNIGCDNCVRWYHLRCTTLKNLTYVEAASTEYECEICKQVQKIREEILEPFDD